MVCLVHLRPLLLERGRGRIEIPTHRAGGGTKLGGRCAEAGANAGGDEPDEESRSASFLAMNIIAVMALNGCTVRTYISLES